MKRIEFIQKAFEYFNYHYESDLFDGTLTFKIKDKEAESLFDNDKNKIKQKDIIFNNNLFKNFLYKFCINNKLKKQINIQKDLDYYELEDNNIVFNISFDINELYDLIDFQSLNNQYINIIRVENKNGIGIYTGNKIHSESSEATPSPYVDDNIHFVFSKKMFIWI